MPELPEVETICRGLTQFCVGAKVVGVRVYRAGFIKGSKNHRDLFDTLTVARVHRQGKQFALESVCGRALLFHMGMSGSLTVWPSGSTPAKHVHVLWSLSRNNTHFELHHKDPRRFGYVRPYSSMQKIREDVWSRLGPDALCVQVDDLVSIFKNKKLSTKACLLNQSNIAGVGNIYADETLFQSAIHPLRRAGSLSRPELVKLIHHLQLILNRSIRGGGSTIQDHQDAAGKSGTFQNYHQVYGRGGLPCMKCGAILKQTLCSQRTTVFCAICQPRRTQK